MNSVEIRGLADGSKVDAFLQVRSKAYRIVASGKGDIFVGELGDNSGVVKFIAFSGATINCKQLDESIGVGSVVHIIGVKGVHDGYPQIVVSSRDAGSISAATPEQYGISNFVPKTDRDVDSMWFYVSGLLDSIREPSLRALVSSFTADSEWLGRFRLYYGARTFHHPWIGGLLEHVWEVLQYCELACKIHPSLDRDLVYAGAFLHDVGVLSENSGPVGMAEGRDGFMMGHIYLSAEAISRRISSIAGFPESTRTKLLNVVLSHHAIAEENPGVQPRTPEAITVAYADALGSKVSQYVLAKTESAGSDWKALKPPLGWVFTE